MGRGRDRKESDMTEHAHFTSWEEGKKSQAKRAEWRGGREKDWAVEQDNCSQKL